MRLADGQLLNRFWDDRDDPREESWRDDVLTAVVSDRPAAQVWPDLQAGATSGWDFSSRWCADPQRLDTIETINLHLWQGLQGHDVDHHWQRAVPPHSLTVATVVP